MVWRKFVLGALGTALGVAGTLYAGVVVIDPYDTLILSPTLARAPVVTNQRFSYPALARKKRFDSAIIGTSTARLLKPAQFDRLFGGAFVNLSLNSGTAYEQLQLFSLFARHHGDARTVIFAIDTVWCGVGAAPPKFTFRPFPPWLYDENPWNDFLHLFDLKTIEQAGLQFAWLTGIHPEPRRNLDGYNNFLPPRSEYDLARARSYVYGGPEPKTHPPVVPPVLPTAAERRSWRYPTHAYFADMLTALPAETTKIVMFVPYHVYTQSPPGSLAAAQWRECKRRFVDMAATVENAHVLDFMIPSEITTQDENYWDAQHYSTAVAERLGRLMAFGASERRGRPGLFDYLAPADFK